MPETTHKLPKYLPYLPEYKMTCMEEIHSPSSQASVLGGGGIPHMGNVFNFVNDYNATPKFFR
jgi:hypothetical protein